MKNLTVTNHIYDTYGERGVKAFEKRITQLLDGKLEGEVTIINAWKEKASGYGHYYDCIELKIEADLYTVLETGTVEQQKSIYEAKRKNK